MKVKLVPAHNFRCIGISKPQRTVPRAGWEQAFRVAERAKAEKLLINDTPPNDFDRHEWRW
jgi:hypothetical protein